jgi:hypothetical protein
MNTRWAKALPSPCAKFMSKPLDKIPQERDRLIVFLTAAGHRRSAPGSCDQSLRRLHRAGGAKQVQRRPSILDSCPDVPFSVWIWPGWRVATAVVEIAGGTDEVDCRAQLLVTEQALMLFPALKPGPGYHATGANQGTNQHGQEVRHGSQGSHESSPYEVELRS